ncbi:CNDP dipeptidase [Auriculariales sp. MPI-PUGE-AT-0066]|nr:CNDP dipeptidase [Auriculariales sp. MPI-PUGE-AT-0066]
MTSALPAVVCDYLKANEKGFVDRLSRAVAIPSVSCDAAYRKHVFEMADFIKAEFAALGVTARFADLGTQVLDGETIQLPPAILAQVGEDTSKPTVLLYAHYDVQPALKSDGWDTDPFTLTYDEKNERWYGRGSTDDKGPLMGWINVLEAHVKTQTPLPVNLKFCLEGMEETGSEGLDDLIKKEAQTGGFLTGVDAMCISDNYWLNTRTPCLTYGLRGIAYYQIKVSGPGKDLHSGVFGGTVHEPMTDLVLLMSKLVSTEGKILVPGVYDLVKGLQPGEKELFEALDYGIQDVEASAGGQIALSSDRVKVLMGRMREPSLSLHGIEGAFYAPGAKTVIPASVSGKFSIRLVPDQTPENVTKLVEQYLQFEFTKLNSKNKMTVELLHGGKPWVDDPNHWNFQAAKRATESVYGKSPDFTREGGSIPVTLTFADSLKKSIVLLPMGRGDDGAHSTNEKLDKSNYLEGTKLLGTYLWEVSTSAQK